MKLPYLALLTIISILLTLLHSYKSPTTLQYSTICTRTSICTICPQIQYSAISQPLKKYTRVSHTQKFYVLSTSKYQIIEKECKYLLQFIKKDQRGVMVFTQLMRQKLENVSSSVRIKFYIAEQVSVASGTEYHAIVSETQDYYIFYEAETFVPPIIYVQNEANPNRLMSLSRSISWGMLFALTLKYIDSYIGVFNPVGGYPFPLVESLTLSYIIYISYQMQTFSYLYVAYLMFLLYLVINLVKIQKIVILFAVFLVFLAIGQPYLFVANLLWLLYMKKIYGNLMKQCLRKKISSIIVLIGVAIQLLVLISKFNYFIYLSYAFKVASVVVGFMMFQVDQVELEIESKKKQENVSTIVLK